MCKMLKDKLDIKHIDYEIRSNVDEMLSLGIKTVPTLRIDDESTITMNLKQSLKWLERQ